MNQVYYRRLIDLEMIFRLLYKTNYDSRLDNSLSIFYQFLFILPIFYLNHIGDIDLFI